ncbi:hypothetical protein [Halovenus marina]|uniref:hypothetical protein n=1 Tax=Halovenus marina TaxID=3396621 RepID=UPI003F566261
MTGRDEELRDLASTLREHDAVHDAFLAKSFTDHLLIVDNTAGERLPEDIVARLRAHDLRGANEVYSEGVTDVSFAGDIGNATRHQFVDVRTRGDHQSYTVE